MRPLIYFTMTSLDGFIARPDDGLDWVIMDGELHQFVNDLERSSGVYLYGRRMYELMQPYWSQDESQFDSPEEREYAQIWQSMPMVVFSSTLESVEGNARLERGDAVEAVRRMKAEAGGPLGVGGAGLAGALMRAGLVDEYRLFFMPVLIGEGIAMFPPQGNPQPLRLIETRAFSSGVVYLRYAVTP